MKRVYKDFEMKDLNQIDKLCKVHCTVDEICGFFDSRKNTYSVSFKEKMGITLQDYITAKVQGTANPSLRRMQLIACRRGSVPMLIWLGKQYLKQVDKSEVASTVDNRGIVVVPAIASVEDWQSVAQKSQQDLLNDSDA